MWQTTSFQSQNQVQRPTNLLTIRIVVEVKVVTRCNLTNWWILFRVGTLRIEPHTSNVRSAHIIDIRHQTGAAAEATLNSNDRRVITSSVRATLTQSSGYWRGECINAFTAPPRYGAQCDEAPYHSLQVGINILAHMLTQ